VRPEREVEAVAHVGLGREVEFTAADRVRNRGFRDADRQPIVGRDAAQHRRRLGEGLVGVDLSPERRSDENRVDADVRPDVEDGPGTTLDRGEERRLTQRLVAVDADALQRAGNVRLRRMLEGDL
jgi:hypothetical protein